MALRSAVATVGTARDEGRGGGQRGTADEELLAAVATGDERALEALYRRHGPWLAARLGRRCADRDLVDQALHDTFVAVWRKPANYRGSGEVGAWLWGIAVRRLLDQLRRTRRRQVADPEGEQWHVSAEEQVLLGVEHGQLGPALDGLSAELRAVVQATILDGLTTREAGRLLGIPQGTVKTRAARARAQLREAMS